MEDRRRSAVIGAFALALVGAAVWLIVLYVSGAFDRGNEVQATFARAGQLLRAGSDVKMRGVLVGQVRSIEVAPDTGRASVTMLLDPAQEIPRNVTAAIRAKTLFGEKFIDLALDGSPSSDVLSDGDRIPQDRTIPPIEVETILERGVPILEAVDPASFAAALHALARGLVGNEDALRHATLSAEHLLTETERTLPHLERNLVHLRNFARALRDVDDDLVDTLEGLTRVGEVIRDHPEEFRRVVGGLGPLAADLGELIEGREADLGVLAHEQRAVLEEVRKVKDDLPDIVRSLDSFLGVWIADLSVGPYWRITATDPPLILGEPYGPGEAPRPRDAAMAALRSQPGPVAQLLDILLAPVPTEDVADVADRLTALLGVLP